MIQPITCEAEFAEAMVQRRLDLDLSQLAIDERAGFQDGYTGKVENPCRPWGKSATNWSFWKWLDALGLVIILVRAKDALRADRCPCCGKSTRTPAPKRERPQPELVASR